MTIAADKPTITADEFEQMSGTKGFELTDGVLVEKNMSYLSGVVEAAVLHRLREHCIRTGAGWVAGSEGGFRCFPAFPNRAWKPDASFVSARRMGAAQIPSRGYPTLAPDLVVEVVSHNDLFQEVVDKVQQWLGAGVSRVWVIDPATRTVEVRRPDGSNTVLDEADELDGEDVLPGFTCTVADLFPPRNVNPAADDR